MPTQKQLEANRRNATKSTGPRTRAGKALSSRNALKHGLCAEQVLLPDEDEGEYERLGEQLIDDFSPVGALETTLVQTLAADLWRIGRIRKIEVGVLAWQLHEIESNRAYERAESYEDFAGPSMDLSMDSTIITDREKYDEAMAAHSRAKAEQSKEIPTLGRAFLNDAEGPNALSKISRYEAAIWRSIYRTLHELQRLQAARSGAEVSAPAVVDVTVDTGPLLVSNRR